ncbi:MAG TPA: NADH-quinone oxidoreductase subunit NuoK [Planctomycetota bacterium]|nr:NADH-quinone oxidoreductase subunit NuoK [Planctomycetota bacterium]
MIGLQHYLALSAMAFTLGLCGVMMRRNVILVLMSIEIMLNAANLALVAFNKHLLPGPDGVIAPDGQVFVFFTIAVAAAEVSVALVIAMLLFRRLDTVNVDDVANLRW